MHYGAIKKCDIANGTGVRVSLFVSGCTHYCKGCFNKEAWAFNYGDLFTIKTEEIILNELDKYYIAGLTVLGGEPFEIENQTVLYPFLKRVKRLHPEKNIWMYSGYTWEELIGQKQSSCRCEVTDGILSTADVLVDGEFILDKKDISLKFRGSSNQRIIDVKESLKNNTIIYFDTELTK